MSLERDGVSEPRHPSSPLRPGTSRRDGELDPGSGWVGPSRLEGGLGRRAPGLGLGRGLAPAGALRCLRGLSARGRSDGRVRRTIGTGSFPNASRLRVNASRRHSSRSGRGRIRRPAAPRRLGEAWRPSCAPGGSRCRRLRRARPRAAWNRHRGPAPPPSALAGGRGRRAGAAVGPSRGRTRGRPGRELPPGCADLVGGDGPVSRVLAGRHERATESLLRRASRASPRAGGPE